MKEFTCIVCPNGCHLSISEKTMNVGGYRCSRGKDFAITEITNPVRTISSSVKTTFKNIPVIPVKTSMDFPKDKIFDVIKEIEKVTIDHPVKLGDVIIKDVCGMTGIDIIATSNVLANINKKDK